MSAIASIGSRTSTPLNYPAAYGTVDSAGAAPAESAATSNSPESSPASTANTNSASPNAAATGPLSDLRQQLETAITQSVDQLPAGSSPQDVFQAVRSAVEGTLKANGIDSQQVSGPSAPAGHHHGHHAHGAGPAAGGGSSSGSSTDSDGDGDNDGATAADSLLAPGTTSADALTQLLQALSAGEPSAPSAAAGNAPASGSTAAGKGSPGATGLPAIFRQLFQGFPNGTGLDVLA